MDVRLPDGTVLTNVPEGTTQAELIQRLRRAQKVSDPAADMSWIDQALAGFGKAIVDTGRGIGQLVGAVDQADIDEAKRLDAPLMRSGGGITGNIAGNLATMIGPAAALGAVGKAAQLPQAVNVARAFMAPRTALGGAGIGAGMSALQPVASDESRLWNAALGGAVGGVGTAAANALAARLGPKAASLTPEQAALVQRAQQLGYELKPSEMTGKRWQQNLEAAMAQAPTTAGRMQAIAARNQQVTNQLADEMLTRAGGQIDQPSAGAAALEGWQQGLAGEEGRLGAAYRKLLDPVEVDLEQARPQLAALYAQQRALPETSQSGQAMAALSDLLGSPGYSKAADDPLASAIEGLTAQMADKAKPKPPRAGYIREASPVPGRVAQNLRSDYTLASATESRGRDQQLFGQMKEAVDTAIEAALPAADKAQFQAINRRYGIYAGLEAMSPERQHAFLQRLYRGSEAPEDFYTFLGLAPDGKFRDVARGFVSQMVEKASEGGNLSAVKLGAAVNKADPEALRVFGGSAADLMRDVGDIGRNVLRDQVANSGTGQRLMYQGLLTGSGLGLGGYLGSEGGSPGAVLGSAAGAFLVPRAVQGAYLSRALRPALTAGARGRRGLLDQDSLEYLVPLLSRAPLAGLLGLSQ